MNKQIHYRQNYKKKKQKERTKLAKKRHAARINHSIKVTQKKEDYGDYLWIDSIPICDMTQLLTNFKTTEFQKIYDKKMYSSFSLQSFSEYS